MDTRFFYTLLRKLHSSHYLQQLIFAHIIMMTNSLHLIL